MKLSQILGAVEHKRSSGAEVEISGVAYDSRVVGPGFLFVAMRGGTSDGNLYIEQAIARGANAIVTDTASYYESTWSANPDLPVIEVVHGRQALAEASRYFFGAPDEALGVTGVTGTNGKTTTAFLLEQMLRFRGNRTVLLGTIEYRIGDRVLPSPHTTPESSDLFAILAEGVAAGAKEAVMEISSHALEQGRAWRLAVDVAIFTNLTQDHLDFHGTMDAYLAAKQRLFDGTCTQRPAFAVINVEDEAGPGLIEVARQAGAQVYSYGIHEGDFHASGIRMSPMGTYFTLQTPMGSTHITSRLVGRINVYNLLAASAAAVARGMTLDEVSRAAEELMAPPGRFETIEAGQDFAVIVDYAHTSDAIANVTALARELVHEHRGRVITVFGCGGDRDRGKRPLMGHAAGESSDVVIVTSDNPRSEDPVAIIEDILPGLKSTLAQVKVEPDRAKAIQAAVEEARKGDLVLIAGKGHEKTQTIGDEVVAFDDAEQARMALSQAAERMSERGVL